MTNERNVFLEHLLPARTGAAFEVQKGQVFRVVDVEGQQVGDFVCFKQGDPTEYFSQAQTRKINRAVLISSGDKLCSNLCNTMFTIGEDKVGRHDILYSPCGPHDYRILYDAPDHPSCRENLNQAVAPYGILPHQLPPVFNVFMNTSIGPKGELICNEPTSRPGDFVDLHAEMDCLVALSACPQDLTPCNAGHPTSLKIEIWEAKGSTSTPKLGQLAFQRKGG